eukprot:Sdes_comp16009_c0_seq1m5188
MGDSHHFALNMFSERAENEHRRPSLYKHGNTQEEDIPAMRVGSEYQAQIPDFSASELTPEKGPHAILLWSPTLLKNTLAAENSPLKDENGLNEFLEYATSPLFKYSLDQALGVLFYHNLNLEQALLDLRLFCPLQEEWSFEEKEVFDRGAAYHHKNFKRIKHLLPNKSVAQLVKYYYKWKKTRRRDVMIGRLLATKKDFYSQGYLNSEDELEPTSTTASNTLKGASLSGNYQQAGRKAKRKAGFMFSRYSGGSTQSLKLLGLPPLHTTPASTTATTTATASPSGPSSMVTSEVDESCAPTPDDFIENEEEEGTGKYVCFVPEDTPGISLTLIPLKRCHSCRVTKSPGWRKGPGRAILCNACGLYWKKYNIYRSKKLIQEGKGHKRLGSKPEYKEVKVEETFHPLQYRIDPEMLKTIRTPGNQLAQSVLYEKCFQLEETIRKTCQIVQNFLQQQAQNDSILKQLDIYAEFRQAHLSTLKDHFDSLSKPTLSS